MITFLLNNKNINNNLILKKPNKKSKFSYF